jgi:hypothetical protein
MVVVFLLQLVAKGLQIAGHGFCIMVPPKRSSAIKGLAIATFALSIAGIALGLLGNVISWVTGPGFAASGMGGPNPFAGLVAMGSGFTITLALALLSFLCSIAWFVVFCLFLRSIALVVRNLGLANTIKTFMISVGAYIGGTFAFIMVVAFAVGLAFFSSLGGGMGGGGMGGGMGPRGGAGFGMGILVLTCFFYLAVLGVGLALFIWYIVILHQVRGAIDRHIRRM